MMRKKEPGDMALRKRLNCTLPGGHATGRNRYGRARKLEVLTLMLVGGFLLLGVAAGLSKEKKPQSKTVSGVVIDAKENFIQGAAIELKDLQTGKVLDIYSQEEGQYQFTDLRFDHDYTVQAMYKGSYSEVRQVSSFDTRDRLVLNLTIPEPSK